jgi:polyhydroxybutyrate depolymerase
MKRTMKIQLRQLALCSIGTVLLLAGCQFPASMKSPPDSATLVERTFDFEGVSRSYLLHLPEKIRNAPAVPVVLVFHGGLGRPENMPDTTGFNTLADTEGFAVAYPRGTSRIEGVELDTWNGGLCCGWAQSQNVDDIGFIRALLDDLSTQIDTDPRRIYAAGLSNGAIFSYRLACELADRIAAIGPVSGTQNIAACNPSRPVSVIHFHGTADRMVPPEGGYGEGVSGFSFDPVRNSVDFWVAADRCTVKTDREQIGPVLHEVHSPCADGTAVELYFIEGGPHGWPGGVAYAPGADDPSNAIDATAVMWEFFKAHPKPETAE